MSTADRLLDLLPVHVRARDEATGGLLRALLDAAGHELEVLEDDLDALYASWFIETCPEWVVPYLADLVGVEDLPPDLSGGPGGLGGAAAGAALSRRAFVANTLAYRRRKGTPGALEQVARDVTGWPARVVELYRLLATSTHSRHVRLDRPATASLRDADALDLRSGARGALESLAHSAEVRRIATGRGRYGIPNVGVFLFGDRANAFAAQRDEVAWPEATPTPAGWAVHPLGLDTPLFAVPAEQHVDALAREEELPVPLRPRRLLALLRAARAAGADPETLPVGVQVDDDDPLEPVRVRVCRLEDLATVLGSDPPAALPGWQAMVDTVTGRVHTYLDGSPATPDRVRVLHAYGSTADIGAGPYDRTGVHEDLLQSQGYVGDGGGAAVRAQVAVGPALGLADALAAAEAEWTAPGSPAGGTYVVSVGDSDRHVGDLAVHVPTATRLVVVAAAWRGRTLPLGDVVPPVPGVYGTEGLRPVVVGDLRVTGDPGSAVLLDGLVVTGDVVVGPGDLGDLTLGQCTVAGVRVEAAAEPNENCRVRLVRSLVGRVVLAGTVPALDLVDAVVDAPAGTAVDASGTHLSVSGATVRGTVGVRVLDASSAILDGTVTAEHRQTGCVRFSYVGPGSRVPRRYRCVPGADGAPAPRPVYAAQDAGSPGYLALSRDCSPLIAAGGEDESEMGAHHHLHRPQRLAAAGRLLAPYVPVGLETGIFRS
ncbi:phage tail protein [Georgenia subflava]|uniref:Uncharacterized protein n=1 Tax=Georgenia subflava TaxID=1622177 RepID=A0A6N7EL86_9MICO|nr:phage tail protein [Georgenia subflava]MPV37315.1 hypothetical protein [Georgenia subflava]